MIVYKLTDKDGYTRRGLPGETKWEIGKTVRATGDGNELCSDGVIHYCDSPEMAVLLNGIQAGIKDPVLWRMEIPRSVAWDGMKGAAKEMTPIERGLPLTNFTFTQLTAFSILVAKAAPQLNLWRDWADGWLSGMDRTAKTAQFVRQCIDLTGSASWCLALAINIARDTSDGLSFMDPWALMATGHVIDDVVQHNKNINFTEIAREVLKKY